LLATSFSWWGEGSLFFVSRLQPAFWIPMKGLSPSGARQAGLKPAEGQVKGFQPPDKSGGKQRTKNRAAE
jgi:hypothetical protein